jgi:uncharacterized protein YjbJ (UPF0337 family)
MTHATRKRSAASMKVEGSWQQFVGKAKELWGELTDDDFAQFEGNADQAMGWLKRQYGEAAQEFDEWWSAQRHA